MILLWHQTLLGMFDFVLLDNYEYLGWQGHLNKFILSFLTVCYKVNCCSNKASACFGVIGINIFHF